MSYQAVMKMTAEEQFGGFFSYLVERLGWTNTELADRSGVNRLVVGRHLKGEVYPDRNTRVRYAKAMRRDPDRFEHDVTTGCLAVEKGRNEALKAIVDSIVSGVQVLGDGLPAGSDADPERRPDYERNSGIPLVGQVAAGTFLDTQVKLLADKYLPASLYPYPGEFPAAIVAQGDSMAPLINNGDVVVIARRFWREPKSGDIVVVTRTQDDDHTIKRLEILDDGSWQLIPRNPDHPTVTVKRDRIRAAAVVVGWYRPHYLTLGRPTKKH